LSHPSKYKLTSPQTNSQVYKQTHKTIVDLMWLNVMRNSCTVPYLLFIETIIVKLFFIFRLYSVCFQVCLNSVLAAASGNCFLFPAITGEQEPGWLTICEDKMGLLGSHFCQQSELSPTSALLRDISQPTIEHNLPPDLISPCRPSEQNPPPDLVC